VDARAVIGYAWMSFAVFWFVTALTVKPAVRKQSAESRIFQMILTVGAFVLIFYWRLRLGPLDDILIPQSKTGDTVALVMTGAGIGFAIWARVYLGTNWSGSVTVKKDHTLVRSGPYSVVRHPIYTGLLLAALGGAIAFGRIRGLLGVLLLLVALRVKLQLEEQFMQEQFRDEYTKYKREVKKLLPFVW
jgi:protein-S-isoprenylcysteine O-methyltransferase